MNHKFIEYRFKLINLMVKFDIYKMIKSDNSHANFINLIIDN